MLFTFLWALPWYGENPWTILKLGVGTKRFFCLEWIIFVTKWIMRLTWKRAGTPCDAPHPEDWLGLVGDVKRLLVVDDHVLQRSCQAFYIPGRNKMALVKLKLKWLKGTVPTFFIYINWTRNKLQSIIRHCYWQKSFRIIMYRYETWYVFVF